MRDFLNRILGRNPAPKTHTTEPPATGEGAAPEPVEAPIVGPEPEDVQAFLDDYDNAAVLAVGGQLIINLSQVQENLEELMDRAELDVDYAWAMEDVIPAEAWHALCGDAFMGWVALSTVVEHAHELLAQRGYPADLARRPLPASLRIEDIAPSVQIPSGVQAIAKDFLNAGLAGEGQIEDKRDVFEGLDVLERITVIRGVLVLFNLKVNAMKERLGRR